MLFTLVCWADPKTICLNMIVKDEKAVIERCLNSVKPYIDHWIIVDTGSTDGTQAIIEKCLCDVPGELFERKWVDFGHNRNEALELAKGKADYLLFIDADEIFEGTIAKERLTEDAYAALILISKEFLCYGQRTFLVKESLDWRWEGVIHEYLCCPRPFNCPIEPSFVVNASPTDGNRSKEGMEKKYLKDAEMLEKVLLKEPENGYYAFYLAQCYQIAHRDKEALNAYRKCLSLKGLAKENVFWAQMQIGRLEEMLGEAPDTFIQSYSQAYQMSPHRAEPLFYLAQSFYKQGRYLIAYVLLQYASQIPLPKHELGYVDQWIYEYELKTQLANCAHRLGWYQEALQRCLEIEKISSLPSKVREDGKRFIAYLKKEMSPCTK